MALEDPADLVVADLQAEGVLQALVIDAALMMELLAVPSTRPKPSSRSSLEVTIRRSRMGSSRDISVLNSSLSNGWSRCRRRRQP